MLRSMLADRKARANRLARAIRDAGFATFKLASERHRFKESTLTSHANGTRAFDIETASLYAAAFGADLPWLMGLDEAHAPALPSAAELESMVALALHELGPGASPAATQRTVASSLHEQLTRYRAAGGAQPAPAPATAPGKAARSRPPTRRGAPA